MKNELTKFVADQKALLLEAKEKFGGCYLTIVQDCTAEVEGSFEIDLEVSNGVVAGTYFISLHSEEAAQKVADSLAAEILKQTGCHTFETHEKWEASWEQKAGKEFSINFYAVGRMKQTIQLLPVAEERGVTPEKIVEGLNTGDFLTTLHGDKSFIENLDGTQFAEIVDSDNNLEYSDFEEDV